MRYVDAEGLERIIEWEPAFDRRDPDPKKDYGVHCVTLRFVLKGPNGATQFVIYTGWNLEHINEEHDAKGPQAKYQHLLCRPMGADVGYHSPVPLYEGQRPMGARRFVSGEYDEAEMGDKTIKLPKLVETGSFTPCSYLNDNPCYYDGSSLRADELLKRFIAEGEEVVWKQLREEYDYLVKRQAEEKGASN